MLHSQLCLIIFTWKEHTQFTSHVFHVKISHMHFMQMLFQIKWMSQKFQARSNCLYINSAFCQNFQIKYVDIISILIKLSLWEISNITEGLKIMSHLKHFHCGPVDWPWKPVRPCEPASSPWRSVTQGIGPPYHARLAPPYRPMQGTYEPLRGRNLAPLCTPTKGE